MKRDGLAQALGSASTWALRNVFHRPAENFPGKVGLLADPNLIAHLRTRISKGTVVVVGTNGKTTVTNLLANALEAAGNAVACNRTGANLDSGIASALLHAESANWGVFESDELWLAHILPQLQPDFLVLLNLFRDQLDRAGEIDHVQQRITEALASSPATMLIYNADDPFCQAIANRSGNDRRGFGIAHGMGLPQNKVTDSDLCQNCDAALDYAWRQYGQLGSYRCPTCGFARETPQYCADSVHLGAQDISFTFHREEQDEHVVAPFGGAYMVYNLLATCAAAACCGIPPESVNRAITAFSPENGRLQTYRIGGRTLLLNLAKNPVGLNQNIRIVASTSGPKAAAFFINDKEADGHDVSWLWDVDFEELSNMRDLSVFAGGIRRNDLQVRLKYAGIDAQLVDGARDFVQNALTVHPDSSLFAIANYTALPHMKTALDELSHAGDITIPPAHGEEPDLTDEARNPLTDCRHTPEGTACPFPKLTIAHVYPELLNLYGDGGNVSILANRARKRGIDVEVVRTMRAERIDLASADIVFLGGGPDREQRAASESLFEHADELRCYVEDDGVLLAICGGFQIIGRTWLLGNEVVPGLGLVDIETKRAEGGAQNRLVGNIELKSPLATQHVIGYENHAGRTFLGPECEPFGRIVSKHGRGNNGIDGADGVLYRNVVGTYLHGPLLAKNPEVADWLIARALTRRAAKEGRPLPDLPPLDDTEERAANAFMRHKLANQRH